MISAIKNQPIVFDESIGICPQGSWDYAQQIISTDCAEWQMQNGVCDWSQQVIEDNDFDNPGANWTYGSGWLFQGGSDPSAFKQAGVVSAISQTSNFIVGRRYQLTIDVKSLTLDPASAGFVLSDGVQTVGYVTSSGVSTYYFTAQGTDFSLTSGTADDSGTFSSVGALELATNIITTVANSTSGTILDSFNPIDNPTLFDQVKDRINFKICWDDVTGIGSTGCYEIGVCDPCVNTNAQNGNPDETMKYVNFWSYTLSSWDAVAYGESLFSTSFDGLFSETTTNSDLMIWESLQMILGVGISYDYEITVFAGKTDITFQVQAGSATGASHSVAAAGWETFTGTIVCATTTELKLNITAGTSGGSYRIAVSELKLSLTNDTDYSPDYTTNKFNIISANECSILINANNHQDAMGFVWDEGNFNPRLRLGARLLPPDDPFLIDRSTHSDSDGEAFNVYFSRRELKVLAVHNEPIFIHRFLSLLLGIGHFYVNDVEYFIEEDGYPQITWNRDRTLGKTQILMSAKIEDIEAVRSQADTKGGTQVSDNLRITTNGETRILTDGVERATTD